MLPVLLLPVVLMLPIWVSLQYWQKNGIGVVGISAGFAVVGADATVVGITGVSTFVFVGATGGGVDNTDVTAVLVLSVLGLVTVALVSPVLVVTFVSLGATGIGVTDVDVTGVTVVLVISVLVISVL